MGQNSQHGIGVGGRGSTQKGKKKNKKTELGRINYKLR